MKGFYGDLAERPRSARIEDIELTLLLEGIDQHYGYDFREYASASFLRRLQKFMRDRKLATISSAQDLILHDRRAMSELVETISVNVTTMFRDATFFLALRKRAMPRLQTYPYLRFWLAGCASGQEAYSLAILLHEEGLLDRSRIYATDFSAQNVQRAKRGIYPLKQFKEYTQNYLRSGGTRNFSDYYAAHCDQAKFKEFIAEKISFAQHNLVTDQSFNEFHAILCRNVMIYFDRKLQEHVMNLIHESIVPRGFLGLGSREAIFPSEYRSLYSEQGEATRLFQLKD